MSDLFKVRCPTCKRMITKRGYDGGPMVHGPRNKRCRGLPEKLPTTKFAVGDRARVFDEALGPIYTVDEVVQEWIGGEWREHISFYAADGVVGAGNADLFSKVSTPGAGAGEESAPKVGSCT